MPGRPLVCMFVCVGRVLVDNVFLGGVRVVFRFLQASWENCGSVARSRGQTPLEFISCFLAVCRSVKTTHGYICQRVHGALCVSVALVAGTKPRGSPRNTKKQANKALFVRGILAKDRPDVQRLWLGQPRNHKNGSMLSLPPWYPGQSCKNQRNAR